MVKVALKGTVEQIAECDSCHEKSEQEEQQKAAALWCAVDSTVKNG